jgi:uncharacterized protein YfaS (alpha-2-macroglobulin family)
MKLKLLIPAVLITAILVLGGVLFLKNTNFLPPSKLIQATIDAQEKLNEERPEDRVYASLDKPFYAPGETIWFSAFVRNATDLAPSQKSEIVRAELINPKGEVEMQYKVPVNEAGIAKGDFKLPNDLPGGQYVFQAYTLWQTNEKNPTIFSKEIQIQKVILPKLKMDFDFVEEAYAPGDKVNASLELKSNENKALANHSFKYTVKVEGKAYKTLSSNTDSDGTADIVFTLPKEVNSKDVSVNVTLDYKGSRESIARTVPVLMGEVDLQFFPEGGDLIEGLTSKVALKATDNTGHAVDVQGIIMNSEGKEVANFASLHMGIGSFELKPASNERYTAKVTFPSHIKRTYKLPRAQTQGYTLAIDKITNDHVELSIGSTDADEISIIASIRGKSHFSTGLKIKRGQNKLSIPLKDFPTGVTQITLFDKSGIARAERMAMVNNNKQLSISIETNKEKYSPREKVEMNISVKDADGNPVKTDLALSVVDDQLLSYAADKSSNLLSWMLLEADIDIDVEEPQYYFDNDEMDASLAMDQLLMTAGWRRFDWKALANNDFPKLENHAERMVVAGTVLDNEGNPIKAKIQVLDISRPVVSESDGHFEIDDIDLRNNPVKVAITAPGHYRQEQIVGDYGIFEYQLFSRDLGKGLAINERSNRTAQALQLGLNNDLTPIRKNSKKFISSIFTQRQMQVVNFRKRWDDVNADEASSFQPDDFETGIQYDINDNRLKNQVTEKENEDEEAVDGAYLSDIAFYRVREFPVKKYKSTQIDKRSDFRSTAYWNGHIATDENGIAQISFWNTDAVTSFKISAEGMSTDGKIGRTEKEYFTQMPFSISAKIPVEVTVGDEFEVPVTLSNNTNYTVKGRLDIKHPANLEVVKSPSGNVSLKAGKSKVLKIKYKVKKDAVEGDMDNLVIGFKNPLFNDKIQEDITVVPRGFPTRVAYSGTGKETAYEVEIRDLEEHTLDVELQVFPSALSEIVQGMEGMMKKPYGCFEQSSSCNYPNILALQYLRKTEQSNPKIERQSRELLKFGYDRISGFESPNGGFEWFGGPVGHEGLTAFAIMQFTHMKEVYKAVDQNMIDRSVDWLNTRKDGKGGFLRSERTTWSLALNGSNDVFNAFIVYCLSEGKIEGFDLELQKAYEAAAESDDAYLVGMAALAHHNYGKSTKANELTNRQNQLVSLGSAIVSTDNQTVFGGSGKNYDIEAKSLLVLNLSKQKDKNVRRIKAVAKSIREGREWNASFGPTHTTVLALRALLAYSDVARETQEDGTIAFYVAGKKVATKDYLKGAHETITIADLAQYFGEGKHDFKVVFEDTKYPLPHTVIFKWNTIKPVSSKDMPIALNTNIQQKEIRVGDQVRMDVKVENITHKNQPTPMAIVGIPAGLSPQVRQLNELVEAKKVAYYEISGNNVILYFRNIQKNRVKEIPFDLKAEIAGNFTAAASTAYTYYNDNNKHWIAGTEVSISN